MCTTIKLLCICNKCMIKCLQGTYITSGIDMKILMEGNNFPTVYFYGKYKATTKIKNVKNEMLGCSILEVSLIRPWEKSI